MPAFVHEKFVVSPSSSLGGREYDREELKRKRVLREWDERPSRANCRNYEIMLLKSRVKNMILGERLNEGIVLIFKQCSMH
jgi:hypothetical protein